MKLPGKSVVAEGSGFDNSLVLGERTRRLRVRFFGVSLLAVLSVGLFAGEAAAADTTRPSRPGGLARAAATETTMRVTWRASSDNVAVKEYRLWRNGTLAGTTTGLAYTFTGLRCDTNYIVMVSAMDMSGNKSLPAAIFAKTAECGSDAPVCPTPATVLGLLLEHQTLAYGCGWPQGHHARLLVESIRLYMGLRRSKLDSWRARRWHDVAMAELQAAISMPGAWNPATRALQPSTAGMAALEKIHRVIRILHYHNAELFEVSKSEKWALTAVTWYIAASRYNVSAATPGFNSTVLAHAAVDLRRGDIDFFGSNCYRAAGRYIKATKRLSGLA
jgi:hypothetical protein